MDLLGDERTEKLEDINKALLNEISLREKLQDHLLKKKNLESLGTLAGGIAHDFNNMLMGITGTISLLQYKLNDNEKYNKILSTAEKSAEEMKKLTNRLLTFAKGGSPIKEEYQINDFIKDRVTLLLSGSNVKPEFSLENNIWPVDIDLDQIDTVFHEIVQNSLDAMENGGILRIETENYIPSDDDSGLKSIDGNYIRIIFT